MAYIKVAERDAVLATQIASPGTQVTIACVATVLEEAEDNAHAHRLTLKDYFGSRTIAEFNHHIQHPNETVMKVVLKLDAILG